jgi:NSS family neurotransmitter:Na+ symporter
MSDPKSERGGFGSQFGFVMAAAGSAVGLGNIWKFPYITGENGGGAFVLVYLGCILLVGLPLMYAELIVGRRGGSDVLGSLRKLTAEHGALGSVLSRVTGLLAVATGFLILSFYSVVAGWAIHFLVVSLGVLPAGESAAATFTGVGGSFFWSALWHTAFMLLTVGVVGVGVQGGIEWACKRLMPGLFVLLVVLLIYVAIEGGLGRSLEFLFKPDFGKLTGESVLEALGHAFFTLSLGMGAMVTYGSYLGEDTHVVRDGIWVAALDTLIALMAGAVIFAVVFSQGAEPGAGPGLVFVTLPDLFAAMPGGRVVAVLFFLLLIFAAWSSAISLLEVCVAWVHDQFAVPRRLAAAGMGFAIWALGLLAANGALTDDGVLAVLDGVTTKYMLPGGGLLIAIAAGWLLTKEDREAGFAGLGALGQRLAGAWTFLIRFVTPVLILLVVLAKIGLIDLSADPPADEDAATAEDGR